LRFLAKHREAALAGFGGEAQAPAQLLQEHHSALGGPQQQHGVDGGDVEPFVEQVDREEDAQLPGGQAAQGVLALLAGGVGAEGF
jgi:hypothetical protein